MVTRYLNEAIITKLGGSKILRLTDIFNLLGWDTGEKVTIKAENNKVIIEKKAK